MAAVYYLSQTKPCKLSISARLHFYMMMMDYGKGLSSNHL
jgi:hypothetical protein